MKTLALIGLVAAAASVAVAQSDDDVPRAVKVNLAM